MLHMANSFFCFFLWYRRGHNEPEWRAISISWWLYLSVWLLVYGQKPKERLSLLNSFQKWEANWGHYALQETMEPKNTRLDCLRHLLGKVILEN